MAPLLAMSGITKHFAGIPALRGASLEIAAGEVHALIGQNGAGKSTFLRCITGLHPTKGQNIRFDGAQVAGRAGDAIHRAGLAMVPEGRRLFRSLTVEENLMIGAAGGRKGPWGLKEVYALFPDLVAKKNNSGTALSGGQQQMVAIGRALMSNPTLMLCDEISLGLAPRIIKDIYEAVPQIRARGTSILVVEQDVGQAMAVADRVYCFMEGRVTLTGAPQDLTRAQIASAYFGMKETA